LMRSSRSSCGDMGLRWMAFLLSPAEAGSDFSGRPPTPG
jgi:hypothetical protein